MELIIGLLVIGVVGYFVFFRERKEEVASAPYKVETPPAPVTEVTPVAAGDVPVVTEVVEAPAVVAEEPAKKTRKPRAPKAEKPAAKKAAPKKAAAMKAKPKATKSKKA